MSTYEIILKYLNLEDTDLQNLKKCVISLRESYRTQNVSNIDKYSLEEYQKAYLFAYYPSYTYLIGEVLDKLYTSNFAIPNANYKSLSFIGCGPGPEIYGFVRYLKNKNYPTNNLSINRFDFDIWNSIFDKTTLKFIQELIPDVIDNMKICDISSKLPEDALQILKESDYIIVQNVMNEIIKDFDFENNSKKPEWMVNIEQIIENLKENSLLIFIDLTNYGKTPKLFQKIKDNFDGMNYQVSIIESFYRFDETLPTRIKNNLLTGENGLIERKNISYISLAIKKILKASTTPPGTSTTPPGTSTPPPGN